MTEAEGSLRNWKAPPPPGPDAFDGRWVRLERLDPDRHARGLFDAVAGHDRLWDFLGYGPFADAAAYRAWAEGMAGLADPFFYTLIDRARGLPGGVASYLRTTPAHGTIEVGHICLAPLLQGSRAATEAMVLMADWAFAAGYRRYEWKCDARNLPSRRAAERLGFSFEGVFRQHMIVKGRNRDTAWFAMTDGDWLRIGPVCRAWLDPANFTADGRQLGSLSGMIRPLLAARDPRSERLGD